VLGDQFRFKNVHSGSAATVAELNAKPYAGIVFVKPLTSYTCKLTDVQADTLRSALEARNYKFRQVPYARFAGEKEKTNVVFYDSGKLVVQGKGTQEFVEFVLEPEVLQEARLGYETVLNPELLDARLGVDESGKGDFFGPLCIAGAYVNETVVKTWKDVGIKDSKNISSDKRSWPRLLPTRPVASRRWCPSEMRPTIAFT
jgi:ribonuclease HIII